MNKKTCISYLYRTKWNAIWNRSFSWLP